MQLIDEEKGDIEGTLIEWGEVGIADHCVQTHLEIQTITNTIQQAAVGKTICHPKCPEEGQAKNQEMFEQMRYGRLILNTEIYPCVKRACLTMGGYAKAGYDFSKSKEQGERII